MKRALVFLAIFAVLPAGAQAATKPASSKPLLGNHDNNAPINISADNFQADLNAKSLTYTGNVVVVQGDTKLRANQVHVDTINGKADKITASGNVVVESPTNGTATGDKGIYSVPQRTVLLTGKVVLKKGRNVLEGTQATVNMATGQMAMTSAKSVQNPGGRVQGVFMPNSQTQ